MMKKFIVLMAVFCLLLAGCAGKAEDTQPATENPNKTIGISLPDFTWSAQADRLTALLEQAGYEVLVEYATGDAQLQHSQVQTLVNMPVGCLIVAPIDAMSFVDIFSTHQELNPPVIALDRPLMYTEGVSGWIGMDRYKAGQQLGKYIVTEKNLAAAENPVTIEFFMGSPENQNSLLFYQGMMEQLQPYLESGVLLCRSGRTAFEDTSTFPETNDDASNRCFDHLAEYYEDDTPDVLCAATDALADGCISALNSFGLDPEQENWPLVVGVDASEVGLKNIAAGCQKISFGVDTEALLTQCAQWADALIQGQSLSADTTSNGIMDVPTVLLDPTPVTNP